jgi:GDP-mannose transporter
VLSLGPLALLAAATGELGRLPQQAALRDPQFLGVAMAGGLLGFAISFTSLWFMSRSSATVYSLTVSAALLRSAVVCSYTCISLWLVSCFSVTVYSLTGRKQA